MYFPEVIERLYTVEVTYIFAVGCLYCALNIALNNYTAYIFGSHPTQLMLDVPMTYSFFNHLLGFMVWSPLLYFMPDRCGRAKRSTFDRVWPMLLLFAASMRSAVWHRARSTASRTMVPW